MTKDLNTAFKFAEAQLRDVDGDFARLPIEMAVFLRVYSAQGVLDNGGLQYFFESDWEGQPPYTDFVDAYRQVGLKDCADALKRAIALFDFPHPHLDAERRQQRMETLWNDPEGEFADIDMLLCGNESAWNALARFLVNHRTVLLPGRP